MKYSNTVEYNISTKLDSSGLTKLQSQIKQLEVSMQKMSNKELIDDEKISAAKTQLEGLNAALTKSFNPSLGILDLSKFRLELESSGVSVKGLQSAFSMMGAEGKAALNGLTTQIANFNGGMERTSSAVDKIFTTFSNTFRWGMVSSFFSQFMNAIHSSVDYVKELDDSLTQIMLVTDYNKDSMNEFARSANEAAKAVSMTTTGMTNASLIFAQQGYDLNQSQELATLSAKVANASQQDTATTSDQITAYMNAYGLEGSISELTQAMDNWALIANISAADVSELAQASQRAASMANAVGVSGEALAAQIATIESVTREAPEQIGNGLKTLYARFSDISLGGEDEDGVGLGKVTATLEGIGVKVLDQFGNIRTMDDIMEDLMVVWDDLDSTTKTAAAQALAGKYQVNRFEALMENSDMYHQYKDATGENAAGTLDVMNAEYANSIAGRSAKMQASLEGLFSTIFNTDDIYPWMDAAQGAVDLLQQFFDALGGGKVVLLGITSLLTQAFSQNMARSINDMVANYNLGKTRQRNIDSVQDTLTAAGIDQTQGIGAYIRNTADQAKLGALSEAQYDNYFGNVQQWADTSTKLAAAEEDLIDNINATNLVYGKLTTNKNAAVLEDGTLDTSLAAMTRQGLTSDWIVQKTKSIDFSDVADEAKIAAFALKDLQSQFDSLHAASGQLAKPIDDVSIALESLTATNGYSSNSVEKIKNELNELRTSVEQGDTSFEDARVKIQKYVNEMERLSVIASEMNGKSAEQILAGGGAGAQRAKTDYDFAQIQNESIAEKANSDQDSINLQQNIKGVLDMVAAMQQLTFAVEAFHNIGSIWSNEDLTQGEKITQTIMNLTTVLFNATTGMKNFYDGMKGARGLLDSIKESIIKQAEAIQQKKALEEQATQTELQNAQQRAQAEVAVAEAEKVTADTNVLKAETALQSAKANLEEAQASLSSLSADQAKIDNIKLIAQAHLTAAQAAIAHAEAEGQVVDPRAEADMLEAQDSLSQISAEQLTLNEEIATATKAVSETEKDVLQKEKELTKTREEANIANEKLIEKQNLLVEATNKLSSIVGVAANVQRTMDLFDSLKTVAIDALDKIGLSIGGLATKIAGLLPVLLPVMAVFGTAYGMFKDIENKKAENSQNYEEAKAQLEKVRSLTEQANNFQQQYESQKGTEQAFDGLADSAKEYAQSLRDLGEEDKAHQVESAVLRAELQNTEEAYQNLSNVVKETQEVLSDSTYIDMMNKAYGAISNTGESVQFLAKQEQELKDKKAELNNLAKDDPYRAELEAEIAELEEFISKNQEAFEAKDQLMSAALDYNLNQASKTNGWQFGILNTPGDEDLRSATLDWQSLNSILEESVPGFAQITNENERLALALAHTSDEAQRAAIQIQQMLNESDNLTDNQKIGITRQLEQSDLSAEQSAQVVAALNIDKESTYNSIVPELQDILKQVNEGENLEVVLKAKLSPEEFEEAIKSQIAAYEPKDEDVDKESFDNLADTFYENKDQMGVEGTPFEDYSENLFENAEALEDVIEGILRYNDAIESLDKSYDDWKDALENTGELSDAHLEAVQELQDTYSDFLGLSKKVSKNFASNAENLELMQEAAEGDIKAFEDLEDAASADIYMQITGIDDLNVAREKIEEINDILANSGIEEIPVGEIFNLDDFESVRSAIDSEIQALELNAEEAAQYVSDVWHLDIPADQFTVIDNDMNAAAAAAENAAYQVEGVVEGVTDTVLNNADYSVSTDIDSDTAEAEDTVTYTNLNPVPTGPKEITSMMPVGNGNSGDGVGVTMEPFTATVYGAGYEPQTLSTVQLRQQTGFKEDVKAEQGKGGGHVGLPAGSGAQGSRRPTGGSGRSSASRPSGGRSGGGGSCFVAGTLISTSLGFKPIEQIQKGDRVLSYNEKLRINEYSKVLQTMIHNTIEPIYTLCIKNEQLRVTGVHRFLVINKITCGVPQWVHATDLKVGDWVLFADGTWHVIHKIEVNIERQTVYNFEVSHNHNYYVSQSQILAHNKGGKKSCFVAGTPISTPKGFKAIETIKPNDIVLSYNEQNNQNEYSSVVQTMIHNTVEPIYTLYIKNEQLRVTGVHKFLITKNIIDSDPQWTPAEQLCVGDWVFFADSSWHVIHKININLEHQTVYNFEVSGNHNYYVGRNQILAHNKGGGKGSGSSGKTVDPKEQEKYQKKYYEEVDHQLEKVDKVLDNVEKTTDKLVGTKARTKQNEQIKLLQREIALQEKKLKILQTQEKTDVTAAIKKADSELEKLLKKEGLNIKIFDIAFDKDGFIRNTDEIGQAVVDAQNELIKKRNKIAEKGEIGDADQEEIKRIDKQIDAYKKLGDELTKNVDRYNDIVNEELEIQYAIDEIKDKIQDINIDIYKTSQEAIDNIKDLREEWAKFDAMFYDKSKGESFLDLDNPIRKLKEINNEISSIYVISGIEAKQYYNDIIAQQQKLRKAAKTDEEKETYTKAIEYFKTVRDSIEDTATLNNGLMQLALNDVTQLKKIWDEWDESSRDNPLFGDNKAALKEALEDAQKRLMDFMEDYEKLIKDLKDSLLDVVDHTSEQWDRQSDRFERLIKQLDRYSDTYQLIYGDKSYDMQEQIARQQAATLEAQLESQKEAAAMANEAYEEAAEKFIDQNTGLAKEGFEDFMYELEKNRDEAQEQVQETAAEIAEKYVDAFEAAVKNSSQQILAKTIGDRDFEHLDRNWEWDKEYLDKYRDNVEKAYEMDKLRSKYTDLLNDAQGASLQTQNKIRAQMQEQLALLDGQATVSEYDVKLANAKLEILQKQIALEDAQRNKNKMQLRRDTQGNYRYVYTANQGDVAKAQQELLDSEYDAYEMSKQQQIQNYDEAISAYKRYIDQRETILNNANLSQQERTDQLKELEDRFFKYMGAMQEDFSNTTFGVVDSLQWLVLNGTDYTANAATDLLNQLLDEEGNVKEQSGVLWQDNANFIAHQVIPEIENSVTKANENILSKLQDTRDKLVGKDGSSGVFNDVSGGANNFASQCEKAAEQTAVLTQATKDLKEALTADSLAFVDMIAQLQDYQNQLSTTAESSSVTAAALRDTQTALDKSEAEKLNYKTKLDRLISGEDIVVNHKIISRKDYEAQQAAAAAAAAKTAAQYSYTPSASSYTTGVRSSYSSSYTPTSKSRSSTSNYTNVVAKTTAFVKNTVKQGQTYLANNLFKNKKTTSAGSGGRRFAMYYDTGGYTGSWNDMPAGYDDGKLAFLHQKELVLNQKDTENILSAVALMRQMTSSVQGALTGVAQTASKNNISSTYNPLTEQRVEINASFPNATDAEDIRQALLGLSDKAYQYAHRTI